MGTTDVAKRTRRVGRELSRSSERLSTMYTDPRTTARISLFSSTKPIVRRNRSVELDRVRIVYNPVSYQSVILHHCTR